MTDSDARRASVEQTQAGVWTVRATRTLDGYTGHGSAVTTTAPTADTPAPHAVLAATRAWAELAGERMKAGDHDSAVRAAQSGFKELGRRYRIKKMKDDTSLRILAAEEQIKAGNIEAGARELHRILESRIRIYLRRYPDAK